MKHLLITTIAAVLLVGCGSPPPDISIHYAARTGDIEAVKQHIAAGTDVNAKDWSKMTPLYYAVLIRRTEIAKLLIANGANVNTKDKKGFTPLDRAKNKTELADLLRKHGGK